MTTRKKVVLFIVEGPTDKIALEAILNELINSSDVKFTITNGDITSDKFTTLSNAKEKVSNHIKRILNVEGFNKEDIIKVVHLADTDGAYIDNELIIEDDVEKWVYTVENIKGKSKEDIIDRNDKKSRIMNLLYSTPQIMRLPYEMYYLSCNLEHVLHNRLDVNDDEKVDLAYDFEDLFYDNPEEFIRFISNNTFTVPGNYLETWQHIKEDNNSLKRFSNFHLFFEESEE